MANADREANAESHRIEGAEAQRALAPFDSALSVAACRQHDTAEAVCKRAGRTDGQRRVEGLTCRLAVMRDQPQGKAAHAQRESIIMAMRDGRLGVANGAEAVSRARTAADEEDLVAPGGKAVRQRVIRLEREGALEQRQRLDGAVRH